MSATPHQDLRHFIRVYDDALPATWCTRLLKGFDALSAHQARNGRELRAGLEESAWTELNVTRHGDSLTAGFFRGRIDEALMRYNADVSLDIPIPNSPSFADLVLKRDGHEHQSGNDGSGDEAEGPNGLLHCGAPLEVERSTEPTILSLAMPIAASPERVILRQKFRNHPLRG